MEKGTRDSPLFKKKSSDLMSEESSGESVDDDKFNAYDLGPKILRRVSEILTGLDEMRNNKLRGICFMDRLYKFYDYMHYRTESSDLTDMFGRQMKDEILNVMDQLEASQSIYIHGYNATISPSPNPFVPR